MHVVWYTAYLTAAEGGKSRRSAVTVNSALLVLSRPTVNHQPSMAPSRALRPLWSLCSSPSRQHRLARRSFTSTPTSHFNDIRNNESRLPRIAQPSLWSSLIPKALRPRSSLSEEEVDPTAAPAKSAAPRKQWNPYTLLIFLAILVGSNAINTIALRNEMVNYNRKTNAKLELLREVVQRVKDGEDVDVRKLLGTGEERAEREWEEVVRDLENAEGIEERRRKREARVKAKADERKVREVSAEEREGVVRGSEGAVKVVGERRPKFVM